MTRLKCLPFQGLSNDTNLRLIQSGRTVPLNVKKDLTRKFILTVSWIEIGTGTVQR
jgi:hypothetical protein